MEVAWTDFLVLAAVIRELIDAIVYYLRVAVSSDVFVCFVKKIYATCKVERCHEIDFTIVYNFSGKNELGCSSAEEVARSVISWLMWEVLILYARFRFRLRNYNSEMDN